MPPKQFPRMTASQILVRRHRNRDGNEDAPAASSSSNGNVNDRGIDEDVPMTQNITVDSSNANDDSSPSATAGNVSSDESQDEEQELVVQVPNSWQQSSGGIPPSFVLPQMAWETNEEQTALRREAIHREIERVQRANFVHFLVLCLVPTALLIIVIAAIVSEDGGCGDGASDEFTSCEMEPRSFANAFTTTCICDAIRTKAGEATP
ncbi:hypothetical protein ACHAXA_002011 [Cyclostephanos tholiformis]|uniref:Uncharacterized protein n=1 Tax=Cyclostephanos tholiformis TaxID=382380 RepID=A0ABD3RZP8_9STRA